MRDLTKIMLISSGLIVTSYVTVRVAKAIKIKNAIGYAMGLIGQNYCWGGETYQTGYDCSGFVQNVFAHIGQQLPRVSRDQYDFVRKVKKPRVGDLIFFDGTQNNVVDHVAIYLGNNKFIHSASNSGVIVSNMNDYYNSRLVGFGRV